jgi:hypothetical protein
MTYEIKDVKHGLWLWRMIHPEWKPGFDWDPMVTCTVVQAQEEIVVIDPLLPPKDSTVLKPDHVRDDGAGHCRVPRRSRP